MKASPDTTRASETDLNSAAWIFEQISLRDGRHVDRSRIRRAVEEAAVTYFDRQDSTWWQWLIETGHSLGQSCRVLDGDPRDLIELAKNGLMVIVRSGDGQTWHTVAPGRGRRLRLGSPNGDVPIRLVSARRVAKLLRLDGFEGKLRFVVIESTLSSTRISDNTGRQPTPLERLFSLLRAERKDIWVVLSFAIVAGLLSMTTPLAVEALVNTVAFGRFLQPIIVLSIMLLAFLIFQAAIRALQTFVVEIIQQRLFARITADLSYRLPRTRVEALDDKYAPEFVNRFFDIVTIQKVCASLLMDGVTVVLSALVGMAVLGFYHPYLLAFDFVLLVLLFFAVFVLGRGAVKTSIKESKIKYATAAWLEDLARCRTAFRYDGAAEYAMERSDQLIFDYLTARKKHFRILIRQICFLLLIEAIASTVLLVIGGWLVIAGQLSLGQLVAAELIVAVVVGSFAKLGKHVESFYDVMASVDKIGALLDLPIEQSDGMLIMPSGSGIVVKNVSYSLSDGREALQNVTLKIEKGAHVALSGQTGVGKTLLLDILFGLRIPEHGSVMINGIDPRDVRSDVLRRRISLARDIEVFEGSILANTHLERPEITVSDVRDAITTVGLQEVVQALPDGMETELSSCGAPLTNTQLRRLMLARSIVGRPEILLIDELLDFMEDEESTETLRKILEYVPDVTLVLVTKRRHLKAQMNSVITLNRGD